MESDHGAGVGSTPNPAGQQQARRARNVLGCLGRSISSWNRGAALGVHGRFLLLSLLHTQFTYWVGSHEYGQEAGFSHIDILVHSYSTAILTYIPSITRHPHAAGDFYFYFFTFFTFFFFLFGGKEGNASCTITP